MIYAFDKKPFTLPNNITKKERIIVNFLDDNPCIRIAIQDYEIDFDQEEDWRMTKKRFPGVDLNPDEAKKLIRALQCAIDDAENNENLVEQ